MKKIARSILLLTLTLGVTACSNSSTTEQEDIVNDFFRYIEDADSDKLNTICDDSINDAMGIDDMNEYFDAFLDEDKYGEAFVKEAQDFKEEVFENLFISYEIQDSEKDGDAVKVNVSGQYTDYSAVSFDDSGVASMAASYTQEHVNELQEVYQQEGYDALMKKVYSDIAPDMFDEIASQMSEAERKDFDIIFELEEKNDKWLITSITEASK